VSPTVACTAALSECVYVNVRLERTGVLGRHGQPRKPFYSDWSSSSAECRAAGRQVCQQRGCGQQMAHCPDCTGAAARCLAAQLTPVRDGVPPALPCLHLHVRSSHVFP